MSKREITISGISDMIPANQMNAGDFGLTAAGDIYVCFIWGNSDGGPNKTFLSLGTGSIWGKHLPIMVKVMPPGSKFEVTV